MNLCQKFGPTPSFYLLDGLGLLDFLGDFFRDDLFGFEVFAHPAAHLFGDLDEPLHWRQPGCPVLAHGHRAHGAHGSKILARRGRRRLVAVRKHFFLEPIRAAETEFGQLLAEGHQLDGGLAFMRIGDTAGEQIGVIGEDVAAFAAAGDGDVKLFAVDSGEGARGSHEQDVVHCLAL